MSLEDDNGASIAETQRTAAFFYPLLFLVPDFAPQTLDCPPFRLARRKWETSTLDLATLAVKHKLHLPYQAMDVFLSRCNMELCISGKCSMAEATEAFQLLRVALYSSGVSPFLCPFVTTYSINDYSGINSRDSEILRAKMYPGMETGLTSEAGSVEAWPLELSFQCSVIREGLPLNEAVFVEATQKTSVWERLLVQAPQLQAVIDATVAAPMIGAQGQSLLHIWTGLEALFPSVSTEVSFRLALYIAQLAGTDNGRLDCFHSVRAAYGVRSKLAHGSKVSVTAKEWQQSWLLLMDCLNALCRREILPSEEDLLREILA